MVWRVPVGSGWSSAVVSGGRVIITDVQVEGQVAKERVLCLEETTGRPVWTHEYAVAYPAWALVPSGGGPRATPVIHQGKVYTLGALGHLCCLDLAKGSVVWEKNLAREYGVQEFTGISGSPVLEGDLLILQLCAKPDAGVVAFEANTGREAWKALNDTFTYSSPVVLSAGGQRQLVVWTQEAVTSLDPKTGATWWRELFRVPGDLAISTPVFADGLLLVGGLMFQLDAEKPAATVMWPEAEAPLKRVFSNTSTAMVRDGFIYSARTSGGLVCLEAATGKPRWQTDTVTKAGNGSSIHLTPCGGAVFLFTDRGDLIRARLTPNGYEETSRAHLIEPTAPFGSKKCAWTPPSYANRHVLIRNDLELIRVSLAAP